MEQYEYRLKKNELVDMLCTKSSHIAKDMGILIDNTLREILNKNTKSTIIDFLNEENDNKTLTNILTTVYNLDRDSKFLKELKEDQIQDLLFGKSIYLTKDISMRNVFGSYFSTQTREDLINLLCDKDMLINVLDDIKRELNNVERDELLCLVIDEGIYVAKDFGMLDIIDSLIKHDNRIKKHFKTFTKQGLINLLYNKDAMSDELYNIQIKIIHKHLMK